MASDWEQRRDKLQAYTRRESERTRYAVLFPDTGDIEVLPAAELRAQRENDWLNLPNALTFLRVLLVPVILLLLRVGDDTAQWWAFVIFVFAALTDTIDGWVARRWHGVTRWGQLADPIADKLLVIGTLATLAWLRQLPWWAVAIVAVREVAVTLLRVVLVQGRDLVMPASNWGKAKTVTQILAVSLFLLPDVPTLLRWVSLWIAVAATAWSGLDYFVRGIRILRADEEDR